MLKSDLLELLRQGEGPKLEFKRDDVRPERLAREIVAFANVNGGRILIGVDDNGECGGVRRDNPQSLQTWLMDVVIGRHVNPPITPDYEQIDLDGKTIAVVSVPRGAAKPYAVRHDGREYVYVRRDAARQLAQREEMARLFAAGGGYFSVEKTPIQGCKATELDGDLLRSYFVDVLDYDGEQWENERDEILRSHDFLAAEYDDSPVFAAHFACILFAKKAAPIFAASGSPRDAL